MIDLSKCVVLKDGLVDPESTLKAVFETIVSYNTIKANDLGVVGDAVMAVFDEYRGTNISPDTLCNFAIAKLSGVTPPDHKRLCERASDYVQAQLAAGVFGKKQGRGRGYEVFRTADQKPKA